MDDLFTGMLATLGGGGCLGVIFLGLLLWVRYYLWIGRPNEVLIFSGSQRKMADGSSVGYRVKIAGWSLQTPFLEKVDQMDLGCIPLDLHVTNAYSKGGIPLNLHAIANVKISSDRKVIPNAIERFLGVDPGEVRKVAKETLEGHLRGVLAQLTPEEVNEDRLKFANELTDEAEADLAKLGLQLDTLRVLNVTDDVKYLNSIGRERIANVLMVADIAESAAKAEADQVSAQSNQQAKIAIETAEMAVVQRENEFRKIKAEFEANVRSEEERTLQIAAQARAEAEQELQGLRKRLEELRLQAEMVLPAHAQQRASALRARGDAADIAEDGAAKADVLRMLTETWRKAGPDARDIVLIQQLEAIVETVSASVRNIEIGEVNLLDRGDGRALAAFVGGFPATVTQVLSEMTQATGVNVPQILSTSSREKN